MTSQSLPHLSTPFVGRQDELERIRQLLTVPTCRLLTLVGPGGIGKTRLALEAGRLPLDAFDDGTYFVPFQLITSPDFMLPTVAEAVNFHFHPGGSPKQQLFDYFENKSLLLVIDNLEHLLDGVQLLSEMLDAAAGLRILATSRERLNLQEEWTLDVGGLSYPAKGVEADIGGYSAVQLFVQQAERSHVAIGLTDANLPAISRICRLTGGMPLALELAAAWVRALSCEEIASELERSLDILEPPIRSVPERHRGIRVAFEPTWSRLSEAEQNVLMRLSVFRGGFTREAAESVASASLLSLWSLAEKSLLRVEPSDRHSLHELLRQYANEKLLANDADTILVQEKHCAYYAALMNQYWEQLKGPRQHEAMHEIATELTNIKDAWNWAVSHHKSELVEQMLKGFWFFYDAHCWFESAKDELTAAAQSFSTPQDEFNHAAISVHAAWFCSALGLLEQAESLLESGLAVFRRLDARREIPFTLARLADVFRRKGNVVRDKELLDEALLMSKEIGDQWEMAYILVWHGLSARFREDYEQAILDCQRSLAIFTELDNPGGMAESLGIIGASAYELKAYDRSKHYYQQALLLAQRAENQFNSMASQLGIAISALGLKEYHEATAYFQSGLTLAVDIGIEALPLIIHVLSDLAAFFTEHGELARATEYCAFALHQAYPELWPSTRNRVLPLLNRLETELPADVVQSAMERGQALSLREGVDQLLSELKWVVNRRSSAASLKENKLLSERELEILRLMADGLSNREIADRLVLAVSTAKWYASEIYSKLHVASRTQAIVRARELGLIP